MLRGLLLIVLITCGFAGSASAQTGAVDQIRQENVDLGPGCNAIGIALESSTPPISPSQEWLDDHAACFGGGLRFDGFCSGHTEGDRQFEMCMVSPLVDAQAHSLNCDGMMISSIRGPFGPDRELTDAVVQMVREGQQARNLPAPVEAIQSCSAAPSLIAGTSIIAAFWIDRLDSEFVLNITTSSGDQGAFVVTEQRFELAD